MQFSYVSFPHTLDATASKCDIREIWVCLICTSDIREKNRSSWPQEFESQAFSYTL